MTKSDLEDVADDPVSFEEIEDKCRNDGFQAAFKTSSKDWDSDFNVHMAFNKTLSNAYDFKYGNI